MAAEKFSIDQRETDKAIVLHFHGELDLEVAATLFRDKLETVVYRTEKELVLDLTDLSYIDSTGIGILVSVLKIRNERKAALTVQNIPAGVRKLLEITGISQFLLAGVKGDAH
ncbi:STAS domain-containing protein [Brevibacillus centrosporus]|uniref:STAS domain-containing protein n=1 Tax=Brevibacillus centrosporus TaxID=54910 RepID=UPI002E1D25B9|nr:STAS domain-containing protein [Brevibacillus centrosporus]